MSVEVSNINFSAGHFLVGSEAKVCERLHGHNYYLKVKIHGLLNENSMLADFRILKRIIKNICSKYDHKLLLPSKSKYLKITEMDNGVNVKIHNRVYVFPGEDILILPISNTTTEELSRLICEEIADNVKEMFRNLNEVEVFVEENKGQGAWSTITLDST